MRLVRTVRFFAGWLLLALAACAAEVTVFAAASLADALADIAPRYTQATGYTLRLNLGASGTLARQIREGARADVFLSADAARVDQLQAAALVVPETRRVLLTNTLVVVTAKRDGLHVDSLRGLLGDDVRRIAIGEPATVPAGTYAKQYLQANGLWEPLQPKFIALDNVRAALAAVAAGNVEIGFVYATDARVSREVRVLWEIPATDGPAITYVGVVVQGAREAAAARALLAYLSESEAEAVFARHGFSPVHR